LTAGGRYILALALADNGRKAGIYQNRLKLQDILQGRGIEWNAFTGIKWNQIDLAWNVGKQPDQAPGVSRRVVHICQEQVFKGYAPSLGQGIGLAGGKQCGN